MDPKSASSSERKKDDDGDDDNTHARTRLMYVRTYADRPFVYVRTRIG